MILESEKKIHREQGKKWTLRRVYQFGHKFIDGKFLPYNCEYEVLGFRKPKAGEWFLSGARPSTYQATNDMSIEMLVLKPTKRVVRKTVSMFTYV